MAKSLINVSNAKAYALEQSVQMRGGKFTRVSKEFLVALDSHLRHTIESWVHRHPSVGKTLYPVNRDQEPKGKD